MKWYYWSKTSPEGKRESGPLVYILILLLLACTLWYINARKHPAPQMQNIILSTVERPPFQEDQALFNTLVGKSIENVVELPSGQLVFTFSDFSNLILHGVPDKALLKQYFPVDRFNSPDLIYVE